MAQNNTAARQRLFRTSPNCFWCGKLTVLSLEMRLKHDAATVDHLYSRLHPERIVAGRRRGRLVLACNQCNKDRSIAETRGLMFVPKIEHRREIAKVTTISPSDAPVYKSSSQQSHRVVLNPPNEKEFGWTDVFGDLRPRSWEEYCKHRPAFIGDAFFRRPKLKAVSRICTLGELLAHKAATDKRPGTVAALHVAERGKYVREPYVF